MAWVCQPSPLPDFWRLRGITFQYIKLGFLLRIFLIWASHRYRLKNYTKVPENENQPTKVISFIIQSWHSQEPIRVDYRRVLGSSPLEELFLPNLLCSSLCKQLHKRGKLDLNIIFATHAFWANHVLYWRIKRPQRACHYNYKVSDFRVMLYIIAIFV